MSTRINSNLLASPDNNLSGIYCIRNAVSGRVYVGSAGNIKRRWAEHRSSLNRGKHHSPVLQKSWTKHGPSAFVFEIIEHVPCRNDLVIREQYWVDKLKALDRESGFNMRLIVESSFGMKRSQETAARISAAKKGCCFSTEHRANISAAKIGSKHSLETRDKMRVSQLGRKHSVETLAKMSAAKTGKIHSAQHLAKMSASRLGWKHSPESLAKMYGHECSKETRAKLSAAGKGRKCSAETRAKIGAANKGVLLGRKQSAETIHKRMETMKARGGSGPVKDRESWLRNMKAGRQANPWVPSEEHRKMLSLKLKGRVFTPEWKAKISSAKKGKRLPKKETT